MADDRPPVLRLRTKAHEVVKRVAAERKLDYADALDAIIREHGVVTTRAADAAEVVTKAPASDLEAAQPVKARPGNQRTDLSALKREPEEERRYQRGLEAPTKRAAKLTAFADQEREYDAADFGLGPRPGDAVAPSGSGAGVTPPPGGWDRWTQPRAPISPLPPSDAPAPTIDPRALAESKPGALPGSLEAMIASTAPTDPESVIDPGARAAVARLDLDAIRHVEVGDDGEEADAGFTIEPPARRGDPPPPATGDAHGFDWPRR